MKAKDFIATKEKGKTHENPNLWGTEKHKETMKSKEIAT